MPGLKRDSTMPTRRPMPVVLGGMRFAGMSPAIGAAERRKRQRGYDALRAGGCST